MLYIIVIYHGGWCKSLVEVWHFFVKRTPTFVWGLCCDSGSSWYDFKIDTNVGTSWSSLKLPMGHAFVLMQFTMPHYWGVVTRGKGFCWHKLPNMGMRCSHLEPSCLWVKHRETMLNLNETNLITHIGIWYIFSCLSEDFLILFLFSHRINHLMGFPDPSGFNQL